MTEVDYRFGFVFTDIFLFKHGIVFASILQVLSCEKPDSKVLLLSTRKDISNNCELSQSGTPTSFYQF